jgi:hypothetical protein
LPLLTLFKERYEPGETPRSTQYDRQSRTGRKRRLEYGDNVVDKEPTLDVESMPAVEEVESVVFPEEFTPGNAAENQQLLNLLTKEMSPLPSSLLGASVQCEKGVIENIEQYLSKQQITKDNVVPPVPANVANEPLYPSIKPISFKMD